MATLYDLLPDDVKQQHPLDTLDAPVGQFLSTAVPAGYDPARAISIAGMFAPMLPAMSQMRTLTSGIRNAQQSQFMAGTVGPQVPDESPPLSEGAGGGATWDEPPKTSFGRLFPFGTQTTAEMAQNLNPVPRAAARAISGLSVVPANVGRALTMSKDRVSQQGLVGAPQGGVEKAIDFGSQAAGFGATAAALSAIPGAGQAGAAGAAAAAQEPDVKSALISGATTAATAGATEGLAGKIAASPDLRVPTTRVQRLAAMGPGAVGFGAFNPVATSIMHRVTGEKDYPMPTPQEWAQGSGDMLVLRLFTDGPEAVAEWQQQMGDAADAKVLRHAQEVAKAFAAPQDPVYQGMTAADVKASTDLSQRLGGVVRGRTVYVPTEDGRSAPATVRGVQAWTKDGQDNITLLVSDPKGGPPVPLRVPNGVQGISDLARPRIGEQTAVEPPTPQQAAPALPELGRRLATPAVRADVNASRVAEIDQSLKGLQDSRPARNDKGFRRWAQRVERLTAERTALAAEAPEAQRPAPAAPTTSPVSTKAPQDGDLSLALEPPPNLRQTPDAALKAMGTDEARAELDRRATRGAPSVPAAEPPRMRTDEAGAGAPTPAEQPQPSQAAEPQVGDGVFITKGALTGTRGRIVGFNKSGALVFNDQTGEYASVPGDHFRATSGPDLEQQSLAGMPRPAIPGGAKRSANDESADIVKGMAEKPPQPEQGDLLKPGEPERTSVEEPAGPRGYKPGERVRVPYTGRDTAFGRKVTKVTETGTVVGYDDKGRVTVDVERGKGIIRQPFTETSISRLPTLASKEAAKATRKATRRNLVNAISDKAAGDLDAAHEIRDEYQRRADAIQAEIGGDMSHPDYPNVRARWATAMKKVEAAEQVVHDLAGADETPFLAVKKARVVNKAAPEAKATGPLPVRLAPKGLPTKAEIDALPSAAPIKAAPGAKPTLSARIGDGIRRLGYEITATLNPISLVKELALEHVMRGKGEIDRRDWEIHVAQKETHNVFRRMSKDQRQDYLDRFESGRAQATPAMQAIADMHTQRLADAATLLKTHKDGMTFIDDFFPHIWKDPERAAEVMSTLPRRPLSGTRSFFKKRVLPDIRAGRERGLELITDNPEGLVQGYEHNVQKYDTFQRKAFGENSALKQAGQLVARPLGGKAGKGEGRAAIRADFKRLDLKEGRIFAPPDIPISEHVDKGVLEGLQAASARLGVTHSRVMKFGRGRSRVLGLSYTGQNRIETKFGSDLQTVAHELGHQIDDKYGLKSMFTGAPIDRELRALADATDNKNARRSSEKMAIMLQALVHAPELFKDTAPKTYERFTSFLASKPELAPILSIKPSLQFAEVKGSVRAPGAVQAGEYWAQKDLARLLENWMSSDTIQKSFLGGGAMRTRNFLNSVQLGLSGFHANNIAYISAVHDLSIGLSRLAHGNAGGLGNVVRGGVSLAGHAATGLPVLPLSAGHYLARGLQFWKAAETGGLQPGTPLGDLADAYFAGGARILRPESEESSFDKFGKSGPLGKAGHLFPAIIQAPTRAIMSAVERMQVGAFADLYSSELQRQQGALARGETTVAEIQRKAVRDVQDRMGKLNYDNLFWNNNLKTAVMLMVRAPGWTVGTARTMGGAAFIDLPRAVTAPIRGETPKFTPRMAYALAFVSAHLGVGGAYHLLHTGQMPQTLEDYLHPRNSQGDRMTFPTDLRTLESWANAGAAVFRGDKGAWSDKAMHAVFTGPLPRAIDEFLNNQTYRGPIRKPDASALENAGNVVKWLFGTLAPITITQATQEEGDLTRRTQQFFGMTKKGGGGSSGGGRLSRRRRR